MRIYSYLTGPWICTHGNHGNLQAFYFNEKSQVIKSANYFRDTLSESQ